MTQRPQSRRTRANPGRVAAARSLVSIENGDFADECMIKFAPKEGADRRLVWHLVLGVLRRQGEIDGAIAPLIKGPITKLDPEVRAALRIAGFERLFAGTKKHALVDQAVEVIKALGKRRATGFVNAIARRIQPASELSRETMTNHPHWLVERWTARYGEESTDAWCARNNEPPPLYVVLKEEDSKWPKLWTENGIHVHPVRFDDQEISRIFRISNTQGNVDSLPGFAEGGFWVQDLASVLSADCIPASVGLSVLDACAAPGGKSFRLLSCGHQVTAVDCSQGRLKRMSTSLRRLHFESETIQHDWLQGPLEDSSRKWGAVLVDAPCTGLGTVRRHPEIRWRRTPLDLGVLSKMQASVLENAACHVEASGILVYSVCSPEPEEGRNIVAEFLEKHSEFRLDLERETAPPKQDEDAFYMARMVRE